MDSNIISAREDVTTRRVGDVVVKQANTLQGEAEITNAVRFFLALEDTAYVPKLIGHSATELRYVYAEAAPVTDETIARRNAIHALLKLKQRSIIHGDLTAYNFVFVDNVPKIFDWGEARFAWETTVKRAGMDADWFYPALELPDTARIWRRWKAIREYSVPFRGYGKLLDLGTLYGDFVALATSEGLRARGYDRGAFDTDCIRTASNMWQQYGCEFNEADITQLADGALRSDITLLFSVWTYVINQYGKPAAEEFLARVIDNCEILFFENHIAGDGFAADFLTEDYLEDTLKSMASCVEPLVRIPVAGRDAERIVWKVCK